MPEDQTHNTNAVNVRRGGAAGVIVGGVVGIVVGFLVGFFLANGLNREEHDRLRAEVAAARGGAQAGAQGKGRGEGPQSPAAGDVSFDSLTDEQLSNAVAKADERPQDVELQKKVGQGLLMYASQTGKASFLADGARLLKRAHELNPRDYQTTVMAGDAHFLVERQGSGDPKLIAEARRFYEAALATQPEDGIVRTKLGLTYFYDRPPDARRAIREYQRALQADPRQEMALQSLSAALIETGGLEEAARRLDELEKVNPSNSELPGLRAQLEQKRNAAKENQ